VFPIKKKLKENLQAYLFIGPFVLFSIVFMIYPIIKGFINSFYNNKWGKSVFIGFENYIEIFSKDVYILSIKNSLLFVITVVPLLIILGIWISGSIYDKASKYVSFVRVCLYVPVIASMVVMSIIWRYMLDSQTGLVKYFSMVFNTGTIDVLSDKTWTIVLLIFILLTMNIGQSVVLYVADMIGIPNSLVEACKIDGGTRIHIFRYILIPLTKPTSIFIFITQTSTVIKVFIVIQLLTKGGPNYGTSTMMYLMYQQAFENSNTGAASAIGVLMFAISLVLVTLRFATNRKEKGGS
jgi:multiple sugar transport system permease protein